MIIKFKDFIEKGCLGKIKTGISRQEVINLLGEPDDKTQPKERNPIWKYNDLQVSFRGESLFFIGLYLEQPTLVLPKPLTLDTELHNIRWLDSFKKHLLTEGIHFSINEKLTFDTQMCLVTNIGVNIIFQDNELDTIQYLNEKIKG
ncbi:MAG: hypothetical protein AB1489_30540 [Acidobacteriota bacterium]